jgi:hypothetical protein
MLAQVRVRGRNRDDLEREFAKWQNGEPNALDVQQWSGYIRNPKACKLGTAGVIKMYARRDLLYVDWDKARPSCIRSIYRVCRSVGLGVRFVRYDKTARGWHVIVGLNRKIEPLLTVALQVILGSDPKRERFNLVRAMSGTRNRRWNMLFERKV